jgi:hypothetical protein
MDLSETIAIMFPKEIVLLFPARSSKETHRWFREGLLSDLNCRKQVDYIIFYIHIYI